MKVLIIGPAGSNTKTEFYIRRAFVNNGHAVFWFDNQKIGSLLKGSADFLLKQFARLVKPDFILVTKGVNLSPETIGEVCHGCRSAMWFFDAPEQIPERVFHIASVVDTLFLTNKGQLSLYLKNGTKKGLFLPQACDRKIHAAVQGSIAYDISFIGKVTTSEYRQKFLAGLTGACDGLHVWGKSNHMVSNTPLVVHTSRLFNKDLAEVISRSRFILGVNSYDYLNTIELYASNRVWLTLGCGGFFIGYRAPGMETVVPENYAVYYKDEDELRQKINYFKSHVSEWESIKKEGYAWAHANHTYDNRIPFLLNSCDYFTPCSS